MFFNLQTWFIQPAPSIFFLQMLAYFRLNLLFDLILFGFYDIAQLLIEFRNQLLHLVLLLLGELFVALYFL